MPASARSRLRSRRRYLTSLARSTALLVCAGLWLGHAAVAQSNREQPEIEEATVTAPVVVDGEVLFRVRGVSAFPADERASQTADRIRTAARDSSFKTEDLRIESSGIGPRIMADELVIVTIVDADARLEGVARDELATVLLDRIRRSIEDYRRWRTRENLINASIYALVATAALVFLLVVMSWLWRRVNNFMGRRIKRKVKSLEVQSFELVRADRIWAATLGLMQFLRTVLYLALVYFYLRFTLARFPWTREISSRLGDWVATPLITMARAALEQIPNLIFLIILFLVVRYALRLTRLFFLAIRRGTVKLEGFEADWAMPTYKLVRLIVIAFSLVVAYPYIPGSGTGAFQGVSLFLGVVVSLGSSSAISNAVAGFLMTYRRAFRVGDRVKIGDDVGDVTEVRLQVTHLRTPKNEEVVIPNSTILNSPVKNFSTLAKSDGLVLHTTVGIGYETPWRQVEAMLLLASERTEGLKTEPAPFVLQRSLGDFAILYELNAYCDEAQSMMRLYSELHRNILDVFNEFDIAIMTPSYVADPEEPKLVAKQNWFAAPAKPAKELP